MKKPILTFAVLLMAVSCKSQDPDVVGQPQPPPTVQVANPAPQPPPAEPPPPAPPVPPPPPPPVVTFPSKGDFAAVAFEDEYPHVSDEDFNDFETDFKIQEKINPSNQITDIIIDFYPRAVGASYDHALLMVLNGIKQQPSNLTLKTKPMFNGDADVKLTHYDQNLNVTDVQDHLPVDQDVTIFASTHAIFDPTHLSTVLNTYMNQPYLPARQIARLEIHLNEPEKNPLTDGSQIDISQFRIILHVKGSSTHPTEDEDIIDVNPNFYNANGYPFGFVIPADWRWPQEGVKIDLAYPMFPQYRQYLIARATQPNLTASTQVLNWFNLPGPDKYLYRLVPPPKMLPDP